MVGKINVDEEAGLAGAERIEVIPTLVLYRNGKAVNSVTAPGSKAAIERFIQESLQERCSKNLYERAHTGRSKRCAVLTE